jgi:3-oxoacyl-[acyl-carrier-protein] synthase II
MLFEQEAEKAVQKRIVVTGLGTVNPVGNDVDLTWEALLSGRSGVAPIAQFDARDLSVKIAAEVKDFDPIALFDRRTARRNDKFTLFALEAARQALSDAGLEANWPSPTRAGVLIASAIGGVITLTRNLGILAEQGPRRVSPFMVPMMMPNAASAVVSITYGLRGPSLSLNSACATGGNALGEAMEMIRRDQVDVVVCGGSDAAVQPVSLAAFHNMGAVSTLNEEPHRASRPFDADRQGFVMGEGAGVVVLESLAHAIGRGARIYCELAGYGATTDAFHIAAPDETGRGAARAMRQALNDAGLTPGDVDYVNAHGTGTPLNDRVETMAIRAVFGDHADRLAVSSSKSMMGHLMGAAGAVEAIACVKSLESGWVHATINRDTPDPECDLDYVPEGARHLSPRVAMSNSFGFGGHNACLVFQRAGGLE